MTTKFEVIKEEMRNDCLIYGVSYCTLKDGIFERINPMDVLIKEGKYEIRKTFLHPTTANVRFRWLKAIFTKIAKATSHIRKRCAKKPSGYKA